MEKTASAERQARVKKRRPPRAWVGMAKPPDPSELLGPRGLTAEVLRGDDEEVPIHRGSAPPPESDSISPVRQSSDSAPLRDWRFYWDLLSEDRRARILSVIAARLARPRMVVALSTWTRTRVSAGALTSGGGGRIRPR